MTYTYVPLLRWKAGEKTALSKLSAQGRKDVLPLILLGSDNFKPKKATKVKPEVPASDVFVSDLISVWGTEKFFLDASPMTTVTGHQHRFFDIAAKARAKSSQLIPATRLDASPEYQKAVVEVAKIDKRGACLRIDLQEMTSISSWLSSWPISLSETDLIIDFSDNASAVAALGSSLDHAFKNLYKASNWRSVTVAGTSIPDNFSGLTAGTHEIPRIEKILWLKLSSINLPYKLDYGDYATVSTAAPSPNIAWGYPINVKYTLKDNFLICRGVKTTGAGSKDMDVQLIGHANKIAKYATRGALAHCWADTVIDEICANTQGPQGLPFWVALGVNRHIELVRSILA